MLNKIQFTIILFLSILFLTSCSKIQSVEDINIIQIAGYDYIDEEQTKGTISVPQFSRVETGSMTSEIYYTAIGETLKDIHAKLQGKSSRPLIHGKVRINLYGEKIAKNDISFLLDNLIRDPSIGRAIYLGVVDGEAQNLIESDYSDTERTSRYLTGLLTNNIKENFPTTNLHEFMYAYSAEGMDGFMPLLKKSDEQVEIDGIAFFKRGTYVFSVPFSDSFIFKIMKENFQYGNRKTEYDDHHVLIESIGSNVKYHVKGKTENPKFLIEINLTGIMNESTRFKMPSDPKFIPKIEKKFAEELEKDTSKMLEAFQEKNIDPLGLGNVLKSRDRKFDNKLWKEKYPSAQIDVKINVEIIESGISS